MKKMLSNTLFFSALLVAGLNQAFAAPIATLGGSVSGTVVASEDFESFGAFVQPGSPITSGGFTFSLPTKNFVIWGTDGSVGFSTQSLYQNGGAAAMTSIRLADGSNFDEVQFDVGNGTFGSNQYVWVRTYLNGSATGFDFDFNNIPKASTILVAGGGFDEVRVQSYFDNSIQQSESATGAASIDNVIAAKVPEPATVGIFGLGLLGFAVSRRKSKKNA